METKEYIAQKILEFREERGLKQGELGEMLTPPKKAGTISSWETGRTTPDADTMLNLCSVLGVEISDFYPPRDDGVGDNLTRDERELLGNYRSCNEIGRNTVLEFSKAASEQFPVKETKIEIKFLGDMSEEERNERITEFYRDLVVAGMSDEKIEEVLYSLTSLFNQINNEGIDSFEKVSPADIVVKRMQSKNDNQNTKESES